MYLREDFIWIVRIKTISEQRRKAVYAKAVATSYKLKDGIDATVSTVKQHADDVLEEAKDLYAEEKSAELVVETSEK